jgi:hypothetical protein
MGVYFVLVSRASETAALADGCVVDRRLLFPEAIRLEVAAIAADRTNSNAYNNLENAFAAGGGIVPLADGRRLNQRQPSCTWPPFNTTPGMRARTTTSATSWQPERW